jgi:ABC-type sugar transport system, periplasmic component
MKKILSLILASVMALSLAACGNSASSSVASETASGAASATASGVKTIKIGYALNTVDENMQRSIDGWNAAVDKWNSSHDDVKVKFFYTDGKSDVNTQINNVESMILEKPDIIILESVDSAGSIPAAEDIHKAGIYCIETRGMKSDAVDLSWTGFDEPTMSELSAQVYRDYLQKNPKAELNAVLIYGNPAQANQLHRMDGFLALAKEYPDRVHVLDKNYGNWFTDKAQSLMEDWIQLYGHKINCIVSGSDAMSLGAINAMKAAGWKAGDVMMTAVDGTSAGLDQVASGWQTATVKMLMSLQEEKMLQVCVDHMTGKFNDKVFNGGADFCVNVTADTVAKYRDIG